jgi:hypothetical protein
LSVPGCQATWSTVMTCMSHLIHSRRSQALHQTVIYIVKWLERKPCKGSQHETLGWEPSRTLLKGPQQKIYQKNPGWGPIRNTDWDRGNKPQWNLITKTVGGFSAETLTSAVSLEWDFSKKPCMHGNCEYGARKARNPACMGTANTERETLHC